MPSVCAAAIVSTPAPPARCRWVWPRRAEHAPWAAREGRNCMTRILCLILTLMLALPVAFAGQPQPPLPDDGGAERLDGAAAGTGLTDKLTVAQTAAGFEAQGGGIRCICRQRPECRQRAVGRAAGWQHGAFARYWSARNLRRAGCAAGAGSLSQRQPAPGGTEDAAVLAYPAACPHRWLPGSCAARGRPFWWWSMSCTT